MNIPFSKKYTHDLKALYREHAEKRITDEELSQRLDELREGEAQSQEPVGHLLLLQKFGDIEKEIAAEVQQEIQQKKQDLEREERAKQVEHTRQLQKQRQELQTEQQKQKQEKQSKEKARENYTYEINDYVNRLEDNAQRWQRWYTWLQILLLVFSALTATMAGIDGIPRLVVSGTGFVATVAGSLLTTFKIQERIYASRKAVAEVRLERQKHEYHIDEYKSLDTEESFIKLSRSISMIQGQQMLQEVELWNPKREEKAERSLQEAKEPDERAEKIPQEGKCSDQASEEAEGSDDPNYNSRA